MNKFIKKNYIELIFTWILIYLIIILFYKLWVQSFWVDESFSSYVSKYMTTNWLYLSKWFIFERLQVLSFKLFWISDFTARLPSVLAQIWSIILMYIIPTKLYNNKKLWLISSILFWFCSYELSWARDARYHVLMQFVFLLWISTIITYLKNNDKKYLNYSIIIACIWALFHPMLYLLWWLIFLILISKYKTFKLKDYWNTLIVWMFSIIIVLLFWVIWRPWYENEIIDWFRDIRQYFILFREYNIHLITQLWILYVIWIFQIIHSLIKKNRKEILLFVIPFILFFLAIIFKSNLFALRYTLILFPIIILLSIIWIYNIVSYFKNKKIKIWILIWILVWILFTVKFQFVPKVYYMLDITSPQSDFKSAYENIPDNQNVISWMPTLCERYYWNRWLCLASDRKSVV